MPSTARIPAALYRARTLRVHGVNVVDCDIAMLFGIRVTRPILVEGVTVSSIPGALREGAHRCLITIVGGMDLLLCLDDQAPADGKILARVFVDQVYASAPTEALLIPHGLGEPMLEVSLAMQFAATVNYDTRVLRDALRES